MLGNSFLCPSAVSLCWKEIIYKTAHAIYKLLLKSHLGGAGVMKSHRVLAVSMPIHSLLTFCWVFEIGAGYARQNGCANSKDNATHYHTSTAQMTSWHRFTIRKSSDKFPFI